MASRVEIEQALARGEAHSIIARTLGVTYAEILAVKVRLEAVNETPDGAYPPRRGARP